MTPTRSRTRRLITSGDTYYLLGVTSAGASYYSVGSTVSSDEYSTYASLFRVLVSNSSDGDVVVGTAATNALSTDNYSSSSYSAVLRYTLTQVTAIPEPSSFGLLAGIGALALVAARRRRSR